MFVVLNTQTGRFALRQLPLRPSCLAADALANAFSVPRGDETAFSAAVVGVAVSRRGAAPQLAADAFLLDGH